MECIRYDIPYSDSSFFYVFPIRLLSIAIEPKIELMIFFCSNNIFCFCILIYDLMCLTDADGVVSVHSTMSMCSKHSYRVRLRPRSLIDGAFCVTGDTGYYEYTPAERQRNVALAVSTRHTSHHHQQRITTTLETDEIILVFGWCC